MGAKIGIFGGNGNWGGVRLSRRPRSALAVEAFTVRSIPNGDFV